MHVFVILVWTIKYYYNFNNRVDYLWLICIKHVLMKHDFALKIILCRYQNFFKVHSFFNPYFYYFDF